MKIAAFPAYENYKDSRAEWIGRVPSSWALTRIGGLFDERKSKVSDKNFEALSVTKNGILPQLESAAKTNDGDNRKLVKAGDFVINSRSDRKGSSGVSPLDGSVSLINIVLKPTGILPEFCNHILKSHAFVEEYYRMGHGIVADLWTTRYDEMRAIIMALPSPDEQRAIAAFLDEKCAKVDEAVRIKEQQIALLRERRQILIQQAVTRGLNPDAPMKDSGIDWIGQIPAHWEVVPLRRVSRIHAGNGFPVELQGDEEGTVPFMKVSDFSSTSIQITSANNYVSERTIRRQKWHKVPKSSIVTAKIGEALRKNHRNVLGVDAIIDNNCVGFEAVAITKRYFFWIHKVIDFDWFVNPGAVPSISMTKYKDEKIPNPPTNEQIAIVAHIEAVCEKVDNAIAIKEQQIAALKEYKTSLINAAVTGKIKVV